MPYFHICPIMLGVGSVILPGNWGRLEKANLGGGNPIIFREYVLETMRAQHFPDKPTRMEATFSCPDIESAILFMQKHRPTELCYEIEFVDEGPILHMAPCDIVEPGPQENTWEWATRNAMGYWTWNPANIMRPMEIVSSSAIRIVQPGKNLQELIQSNM